MEHLLYAVQALDVPRFILLTTLVELCAQLFLPVQMRLREGKQEAHEQTAGNGEDGHTPPDPGLRL